MQPTYVRGSCPHAPRRPACVQDAQRASASSAALFAGVPICSSLGDQQAALLGQRCTRGLAKNTYGTGAFLLVHTGFEPVFSKAGLLTTIAHQLGRGEPASYAVEGSIAVAGFAVSWLRDQLGIISDASETEALASSVDDTGGRPLLRSSEFSKGLRLWRIAAVVTAAASACRAPPHDCGSMRERFAGGVYFVPAFSGLLAPHWRDDARGVLVGMTHYTDKRHIVRAALEAIAFQTVDVLNAIKDDVPFEISTLRVDGGATKNDLLMQIQVRPSRPPLCLLFQAAQTSRVSER